MLQQAHIITWPLSNLYHELNSTLNTSTSQCQPDMVHGYSRMSWDTEKKLKSWCRGACVENITNKWCLFVIHFCKEFRLQNALNMLCSNVLRWYAKLLVRYQAIAFLFCDFGGIGTNHSFEMSLADIWLSIRYSKYLAYKLGEIYPVPWGLHLGYTPWRWRLCLWQPWCCSGE